MLRLREYGPPLVSCGNIDLSRRIQVHRENADPHDQVRPRRNHYRRHGTGCNDRHVCQSIVSGGEERRTGQASAMGAKPGKEEGAEQVDAEWPNPVSVSGNAAGGEVG